MYERILVPTDGSEVADAAVDAAIALAGRFDAELHVVHVLEIWELPPGARDVGADEFAKRGRDAVSAASDDASAAGVEVTTVIVEEDGPVHQAILAYAETHDVDCLVMGTYGRTGLDRLVLGSATERTLRESPVPVLTVHEETSLDAAFDGILVPTDNSASALAAADHAIELAVATGATLHVLSVVDRRVIWDEYDTGAILEVLEEAGERAVRTVIDRAEKAAVPTIESAVVRGKPHRAILDYVADHDVGLIVMGTHGRTGFDRLLLGSITERVVRLSDVPVLSLTDRAETD